MFPSIALRPQRKWISTGSKQVKKLKLGQFKASQLGLTTGSGGCGRAQEYLKVQDAQRCVPLRKLVEVRVVFQLGNLQQA